MSVTKIKMGKIPFKKEVIGEGTTVTLHHLLRSLPFTTKSRLCTIRKQPLYETLLEGNATVRKSYGLKRLLEIAKEEFQYEKALGLVNRRLSTLQRKFKVYLKDTESRLIGPGIPITRCVNEDCPYTMEALVDISRENIFTWKDDKIYGCDFQALYGLIAGKLERSGTLYEQNMDQYDYTIEEYGEQRRRNRRYDARILNEITNPFTRQKFPVEALRRVIQIAKRKGLVSNEPRNQRIRQRRNATHENQIEMTRPEDNDDNIITVSIEISERMRALDFYTPETIILDIIKPVFDYLYPSRDRPRALEHAHSIRMHNYIANQCVPVLEHISDHFTNPLIRRNPIFYRSQYRMFIPRFRRGIPIRNLREHIAYINDIMEGTQNPRVLYTQVRRLSSYLLTIWSQAFGVLLELLNSESVNIDDKKNIVIFIIISLAQTGHLREGFEWAIGI
jgi:hypothetical protein